MRIVLAYNANAELLVTQQMLSVAKSEKAAGVITMPAWDFLFLTINKSVDEWVSDEKDDTKPLDFYNGEAHKDRIRVMPFLDVEMDTGKVVGHEGRHRAAALMANRNHAEMQVAIYLRRDGYKVYYTQPYIDSKDYTKRFIKKFVSTSDIPKTLIGQFSAGRRVPLNMKTFQPFYPESKV